MITLPHEYPRQAQPCGERLCIAGRQSFATMLKQPLSLSNGVAIPVFAPFQQLAQSIVSSDRLRVERAKNAAPAVENRPQLLSGIPQVAPRDQNASQVAADAQRLGMILTE